MNVPVWARRLQTVPAAVRRDSALPNLYDLIVFVALAALGILLAKGAAGIRAPISALEVSPISLDPAYLPGYALRSTLRMFAAIGASLLFTFVVGTLASKSRKAELVLIPALDILQSVPVLGFLTFTVVFFMGLFPGSQLGAELAAIFAIFTSQAWNMAFSFYQSLSTLPRDLDEASRHFKLSAWLRFWRLEAPYAAPGLVWNTMMSMSGGWFFVVASEVISVGNTKVQLPGIGSYIALAIDKKDLTAIAYAVTMMAIVILIYDQLIFRPIVAWTDKFRFEMTAAQARPRSWVYDLVRRTRLLRKLAGLVEFATEPLNRASVALRHNQKPRAVNSLLAQAGDYLWLGIVTATVAWSLWTIIAYVRATLGLNDVIEAVGAGLLTMLRVIILIALASLIWVPIGVWIGLRPKVAEAVQPIAQFLAAFPANVLFPFFVVVIATHKARPQHLAVAADDPRHPVVHPVQRHCRRQRIPKRSQRSSHALQGALLDLVAPRHPTRHLSLLRHRRVNRLGRLVERKYRCRGRELG